jgi:uncharacterized protein (DUF934 family)
MPLLRGDEVIADARIRVPADAPVPAAGRLLLDLARLTAEAEHLWHRPDGVGVELLPAEPVEALEDWLDQLDLVALRFPSFTDGRPFSAARILRQRYRFGGEIRAVGRLIPDQAQFLRQCGIDTIEVAEADLPRWRTAKVRISLTYQLGYAESAGPSALAVFRARHAHSGRAAA